MSLEWARARALQNEARLRELARSGDRKAWTAVTLASPAVTVWCEPARARQQLPARDVLAANQDSLLGVVNIRD